MADIVKRPTRRKSKKLKVPQRQSVNSINTAIPISKIYTKKEIYAMFLNELLENVILKREQFIKKMRYSLLDDNGSSTDNIVSKEYKDIEEKDLEQASAIKVDGSKLVLDKSTSIKKSEMFKMAEQKVVSEANIVAKDESSKNVSTSLEVLKDEYSSKTMQDVPLLLKYEKIYFANGNFYEGPTNEYMMHGEGKFMWADKTVYEGEFKNGCITGKGEMVLPDLSRYEGQFCNGFFHGKGFLNMVSTPRYYYGEWKNGRKDGEGWILYEPGDWYEGTWKNDLRHGNGFRTYKNGAKYKGDWVDNKRQGKGKMLLHNNDYYSGEWLDNKPHGYGEYTWDLIFNKTLCFPIYNWYKGSWKDGQRDGVGIMNFGTESGARYAGTWRTNFKHGAGVMICGNGLILESNPLFEFNKPAHKNVQVSSTTHVMEENLEKGPLEAFSNKSSYYQILNLIGSQTACSKLDENILKSLTINSRNIPSNLYTKPAEQFVSSNRICCPLDIPTHTIAEDVDLKYFVDLIFKINLKNITEEQCPTFFDLTPKMSERFSKTSNMFPRYSIAFISESMDMCLEDRYRLIKQKEIRKLKNSIIINLLKLKTVYDKYASFARSKSGIGEVKLEFKPVLVRFYLWQMFRDLQVCRDDGVQLVDIDLLLWDNPASCLDTKHYPFEPIYFYQYVQYLMGAAWLTFLKTNSKIDFDDIEDCEHLLPSSIFRKYIDSKLEKIDLLHESVMADYLNIVPLHRLYETYLQIGEPITTKTFLNSTYREKDEEPPCYYAFHERPKPECKYKEGYNAVAVAHDVYFISDPLAHLKEKHVDRVESDDKFGKTLFTFRSLEKNAILNVISKVCPSGTIPNMEYKLTFLEYYEIIVRLAFLKADQEIKKEQLTFTSKLPTMSEMSYRSKTPKKKKNK